MPMANPKNYPNAAAVDLGVDLGDGSIDMETADAKKKKLLQQQQELMGRSGASVFGLAATSLLGGAGG